MVHDENGPGGLEGLRVMVIDDSKTIRRTAETLLRREGADVTTATDGFEALAKIADQRPQIIFVDIMMPRLDGYQTCALIKNNQLFKNTPVIMLSSKDGLFDKARGRIVGSGAVRHQAIHARGTPRRDPHARPRLTGGKASMARILLIEDSPTDAAVLSQLLQRNGHQVLTSGSAEDGIEVCKRELPDLVLMDVVLPGMNGFRPRARCRATRPRRRSRC